MKKRTKREQAALWKTMTKKAVIMIGENNKIRMSIADCAIEACDIKRGGGGHWDGFNKQYTIKNFALEIGIQPKTLNEWVRVRQTFSKVIKQSEFEKMKYTLLRDAVDRISKKGIKKPEDKLRILDQVAGEGPEDKVYLKLNKYLTTLEWSVRKGTIFALPATKRRMISRRLQKIIDALNQPPKRKAA